MKFWRNIYVIILVSSLSFMYGCGGGSDSSSSPTAPTENNDITSYDRNTGLTWMKTPSNATYTYQGALNYCENLDYANQSDWYLPSNGFLSGILEDSDSGGCYWDEELFSGACTSYWASTIENDIVSYIDFGSGSYHVTENQNINCNVRCYRDTR